MHTSFRIAVFADRMRAYFPVAEQLPSLLIVSLLFDLRSSLISVYTSGIRLATRHKPLRRCPSQTPPEAPETDPLRCCRNRQSSRTPCRRSGGDDPCWHQTALCLAWSPRALLRRHLRAVSMFDRSCRPRWQGSSAAHARGSSRHRGVPRYRPTPEESRFFDE